MTPFTSEIRPNTTTKHKRHTHLSVRSPSLSFDTQFLEYPGDHCYLYCNKYSIKTLINYSIENIKLEHTK